MRRKIQSRGIGKKLLALALTTVLAIGVFPAVPSHAAGARWTNGGDGWYYLPGTDIRVQVSNEKIVFEGNGALPDYDKDTLTWRPWDWTKADYVQIGKGITYIGQYEFAKMDKIKYVNMYSTTYMADATSFADLRREPVMRITGTDVSTTMYGKIEYTSLDSIAAVAQSGYNGESWVFDNSRVADAFRARTNPTIQSVYGAEYKIDKEKKVNDGKAPWEDPNDYTNDVTYTNMCDLTAMYANPSYYVIGQKQVPGRAAYEAFGAFLGDYQYAEMWGLTVTKAGEVIKNTDSAWQYVWKIPAAYQQPGRTFKLMQIGTGTVNILEDEDTDDTTITVSTDYPSTAYCLIYVQ